MSLTYMFMFMLICFYLFIYLFFIMVLSGTFSQQHFQMEANLIFQNDNNPSKTYLCVLFVLFLFV